MARLVTCGFECGDARVEPCPTISSPPTHVVGTPTIDTGTVRSGSRSVKLDASGATSQAVRWAQVGNTTAVTYYHRAYVRWTAFPNSATDRGIFQRPANYGAFIRSDGTVSLQFNGTVIGSRSAALSLNTWYRIELAQMINTTASAADAGEVRIDGVTVASDATDRTASAGSTNFDLGQGTGSVGMVMFMDDFAINDSTGTDQSSWPGDGRIVMLDPVSDNARVGFTGGAGGTTSLFDAVNNKPPTGTTSPGTNATQIGDATSSTTDAYSANVTDYTTAGIISQDTIKLVMPFHRIATSATTARSMGIQGTSNPAVTEVTANTPAIVAAAEISATAWFTARCAPVYLPSVTLGTSPVIRVRKNVLSTDRTNVDMMGMYVEVTPNPTVALGTAAAVSAATLALTAPSSAAEVIPDVNFPTWIAGRR